MAVGSISTVSATTSECSEEIDPTPDWFDREPLALRDDVELIVGADDQQLLFQAERGTYTRVSRSGTRLVALLDGSRTGAEIVAALSARSKGDTEQLGASVSRFLGELRQAQVLTVAALPEHGRERVARSAGRSHILRLPLTRSAHTLLEPLARAVAVAPPRFWVALLSGLWLTSLAAIVGALATKGIAFDHPSVIAVAVIVLVQLVFHEMAHALVCQIHGAPVRAAGVGLLFYFVPVAYVDRTDAYRLRRRSQRAAIALAGPANDLLFAGVAAGMVLFASGSVAETGKLLLVFELFALLTNLNPLLPTDGYHALEATSGELNFRSRALSYFVHRVTRQPLPSSLDTLGRGRATSYMAFAALCGVYLLLLFGFSALAIGRLLL